MKVAKKITYLTWRGISMLFANTILILFLMASCQRASDKAAEKYAMAESRIREIERAWAETAVSGDTSVIKEILADDFLGTSPDGVLYTKQDFIEEMRTHPAAFTSNVLNDVKVRFFGDVAVAQGNETFTRRSGEIARFVWTDVLVQRDGKWQIIAAEDLIAPETTHMSTGELFTGPQQNELSGIDSCRKEYMAAWLGANADKIALVYTNDAVVLYPNQPAVAGRTAILSYFRNFFQQYRQELFELRSEEVQIVGAFAFDRGKYKWRATPRDGGTPINDHGKYLVVLQRQGDGSWKVARDMDNSDRPSLQAARGTD